MNGIEKQILRLVCEKLLAEGYVLTVDYERGFDSEPENKNLRDIDDIIHAADAVDEVWLMADREELEEGPYDGFVYFIWGNGNEGRDCITDYSTVFEPILDPIIDWLDEAELCLQ